jgi:DNA-binding MarR family transcriptional regulator
MRTGTMENPELDEIPIPALLRHARSTYGRAMRGALERHGFDDVPANGMYVIGGLALGAGGSPIGFVARDLGVSKQAAGQLIDTLVARGYLARTADKTDRRQLIVTLTDRGRAAAAAQVEGRTAIDAELANRIGSDDLSAMRKGLAALIAIRREWREAATG